jgi:DNA repair protein RecN (Recombination protein N)
LPGEDIELAAEEDRLAYADGLRPRPTPPADALARGPGLDPSQRRLGPARVAKQVLDAEREHDAKLAELADRAGELGYLAADLARSFRRTPLMSTPTRRGWPWSASGVPCCTGLVRKYGAEQGTVDEVLEWTQRSAAGSPSLDGSDERVELPDRELAELDCEARRARPQIREARIEARSGSASRCPRS